MHTQALADSNTIKGVTATTNVATFMASSPTINVVFTVNPILGRPVLTMGKILN